MIRFVIFDGFDDFDRPVFDDFHVSRGDAAGILRKHHRDGAYIERRNPESSYAFGYFGNYYIEPVERTIA